MVRLSADQTHLITETKEERQADQNRAQAVRPCRALVHHHADQSDVHDPASTTDMGAKTLSEGGKLKQREWLILVSAMYRYDPATQYAEYWGIETLFGALKTSGFNLEDTRLTDEPRLLRLVDLLALAITWAFMVGKWQVAVKEGKVKNFSYPPKSVFRLGLDLLCWLVTNLESRDLVAWHKVIKLLPGI